MDRSDCARGGLHADRYTGRVRMVVDEDQGYLLGAALIRLPTAAFE